MKAVTKDYEITINASASEEALFIEGSDSIRLDRYSVYTLKNEDTGEKVENAVSFSFVNNDEKENIPLVTIKPAYDNNNQIIE